MFNLYMAFSFLLASSKDLTVNEAGNDLTNDKMVGGGEILNADKLIETHEYKYLDQSLMAQFNGLLYIKIAICVLIILLAILIVLNMYRIRGMFKNKGVNNLINNVHSIKKRDRKILKANNTIGKMEKIVSKFGFNVSNDRIPYLEYNIKRANVRIPGGLRYMTPNEFNACIKIAEASLILLGIVITAFINSLVGIGFIALSAVLCNTIPMLVIRDIVANKDNEIRDNFTYLYLMEHYNLMKDNDVTFESVLKSYDKTVKSEEMHRFINNCISYIDTYGEHLATDMIAADYKEIPEVRRLMRLMKQQQQGDDIKNELISFRQQLIDDMEYKINLKSDIIIEKANRTIILIMIVLAQAVLSAMAIYLPDISSIKSLL